jgi:hypothetical protein
MRSLVLAAVVLALSGCFIWEDEPQYVFRVLSVAEGDEPFEFATRAQGSGFTLVGPFIAPCPNARITAGVSEDSNELRVSVRAAGCEGEDEPTAFDYQLIWSGLDDGSYALQVRHERQAGAPDGVVYAESIVIR